MLIAIIMVSLIIIGLFVIGVMALVGIIANFKKDNERVRKNIIKIVLCVVFACVFGIIDGVLTTKYLYDNREKIAEVAGNLAEKAVTTGFELTTKGAMAAANTYNQLYNKKIIERFENLSIGFLSKREEVTVERPDLRVRDLKDSKITAIELVFNNNIPQTEELYTGDLVVKNYLIACDKDDFTYRILPVNDDAGFTEAGSALVSLAEFILNREYSKFGKILPGKTKHTFLVITPKDVTVTSMRFLGKQIELQ
ncbi:MAG: hypothetical protein LBV17_08365 [Treponema sp.]|jgi:uncharacterized membrane protein|nr:hypothetical protein [Treponema sp.]